MKRSVRTIARERSRVSCKSDVLDRLFECSGIKELRAASLFEEFYKESKPKPKGLNKWQYHYKSKKVSYSFVVDFGLQYIEIEHFACSLKGAHAFAKVICGIVKNARRYGLAEIKAQAKGRFQTRDLSPSFWLFIIYGFRPTEESMKVVEDIVRMSGNKGITVENIFNTDEGLDFWMEFGEPLRMQFFLHRQSANFEWFVDELQRTGRSHWLLPFS